MDNSHFTQLPGAVGLTNLRVYDTAGPDGLVGGSPHFHFACTECYYIEKGFGAVQTLAAGGFQEFAVAPGALVWFSPGVIHRLINVDGHLEIFVVMQNGGLPEAGDFVLAMPIDILCDSPQYAAIASLSPRGEVFASSIEAAYHRRDVAVTGFLQLRRDFDAHGPAALASFYQTALRLVRPNLGSWREVWRNGPFVAANQTGQQISALQAGNVSHLMDGAARSMDAPKSERRLGMCGTLASYLPEGVTVVVPTRNIEADGGD